MEFQVFSIFDLRKEKDVVSNRGCVSGNWKVRQVRLCRCWLLNGASTSYWSHDVVLLLLIRTVETTKTTVTHTVGSCKIVRINDMRLLLFTALVQSVLCFFINLCYM